MEKYVFLSMLRTSLLQMNVPADNIIKHVEVFEKYFSSKTPEETKKIIKNIGGLDGALEAVYKIESKRNPDILSPSELKKNITENTSSAEPEPEAVENISFDKQNTVEEDFSPDIDALEKQVTSEISIEKAIESTKEIPSLDGLTVDEDVELIFQKRQAPPKREEMEKTTVNNVAVLPEDNFEFATELPPLEDEIMAYKHPSVIVEFFKNLRNKMSDDVYKYTLPLTMLINIFGYVLLALLFPVLAVIAAAFYVLYFASMICGGIVAIISFVYGFIKIGASVAIGLYEIGIGIIIIGITLVLCVFIYLFNKKAMPFLFGKVKELFSLWIKSNKAFFRKNAKEVRT